MNLTEAMEERHSVRQYQNKPLEKDAILTLQEEIEACKNKDRLCR